MHPSLSLFVLVSSSFFHSPPQTLKGELPDPVGTLTSLVSRTISLGIPRASGHLFLVGQLLTNASHDRTLATTLGIFCTELGSTAEGSCFTNDGRMEDFGQEALREFPSFLAAHAVSVSCPDHIKSDVMYVAMELLDCCKVATRDLSRVSQVDWVLPLLLTLPLQANIKTYFLQDSGIFLVINLVEFLYFPLRQETSDNFNSMRRMDWDW